MRLALWIILFAFVAQSNLNGDSGLRLQYSQDIQMIYEHIDDFKDGITLDEWRKEHGDERIEVFQGRNVRDSNMWGSWCLRCSKQVVLDNNLDVTRYTYFYPPAPSHNYQLPEFDGSKNLLGSSELGLIWISIRKAATEGIAFAQEISSSFKCRYGNWQESQVSIFNSGLWREAASWTSGQTTFGSAYSYDCQEVIVFIFSQRSGLDGINKVQAKPNNGNAISLESSRIGDMIRVSKMGGQSQSSIEKILKLNSDWQNSIGRDKPKLIPEYVIDALSQWIIDAMEKPDRQKAAALLVADMVLASVQYAFNVSELEEGREARLALSKLGAHFISQPAQEIMVYSRSLLIDARRLDAEGPVGELCFLMLMEAGFDPTGTCAETSEKFIQVIKNGEEYLRNAKNSAHKREVELMVADAYRDIVALAEGLADDEHVDPSKYKALARVALPKAIEYYRLGLKNVSDSEKNRIAWSEAWRLIAGLPPVNIRYFCIID